MSMFAVFNIAGSGMTAQAQRLNAVASNLANADSAVDSNGQPYRARQVVFSATDLGGGVSGVRVAGVVEDPSPMREVYDPRHPMANAKGYVTLPNVSVVEEMVNMIAASRAYQNNVDLMNTARGMLAKTLAIGG